MDEATRCCRECKRTLPLSGFYRDKHGPGGFRSTCKECHKAAVLRRQRANHAAYLAYQAQYRERPGHREKARGATARYRSANPERVRASMARWMADPNNRKVFREGQRRYKAAKRTAVIGVITPALLDTKLAYWGWRCWMCGGTPTDWDHVKPIAKGGPHVLANLRPACGDCNRRKRDRWPLG